MDPPSCIRCNRETSQNPNIHIGDRFQDHDALVLMISGQAFAWKNPDKNNDFPCKIPFEDVWHPELNESSWVFHRIWLGIATALRMPIRRDLATQRIWRIMKVQCGIPNIFAHFTKPGKKYAVFDNVNTGLINHPQLDSPFLPEASFFVFVQISPLVNRGMQQIPPPIRHPHFGIGQSQ